MERLSCPWYGPTSDSYHASEVSGVSWTKPWCVVSFYGQFSSSGDIRNVHMGRDWDHRRPTTAAVHYDHFDMIVGGSLMKSFAGFVQNLVLS